MHSHDIFWPFEYPKSWLLARRAGNEAYLLRAYRLFNNAYRIVRFTSYLAREHSGAFAKADPRFLAESGGSLWLQRL